ncbi:MAG: hypothetical protein ACRCUY_08615 [Thermoguttaceae bacterium]
MTFAKTFRILGRIAKSFSPKSKERQAIARASKAILFIEEREMIEQYKEFIKRLKGSLSGYEIIMIKVRGLDIPEECRTPDVIALESEIDALAKKILEKRKDNTRA